MIELILIGVIQLATLGLLLHEKRKRKQLHAGLMKLAELTHVSLKHQKEINEHQLTANEHIASNLEILGVHTRLIKPSVGMEAEAFLKWHNRKGENNA